MKLLKENATKPSDRLTAEVFRDFPQPQDKFLEICAQPPVPHYHFNHLTDVTNVAIEASGR